MQKTFSWRILPRFRLATPGDFSINHLPTWFVGLLLLAGGLSLIGCRNQAPPQPVDYSSSNEVSISFGKVTQDYGLRQAKVDHDGTTTPSSIHGMNCHFAKAGAWNAGYIYFIVDPSFKTTNCHHVKVNVDFFDAAKGYFEIQYDGHFPSAPGAGSYTVCPKRVTLNGKQQSDVQDFVLENVRFDNSQSGNADFRIHFKAKEFYIFGVTITRL